MQLLSQRAFARLNNWNPGYVAKLKARGTLVMHTDDAGLELVDVAASTQRIADARDPAKGYMQDVNAQQRRTAQEKRAATLRVSASASASAPPPLVAAAPPSFMATYNTARTAAQVYDAKMKQLIFEEKAGELVSAVEVRRAVFEKTRIARDALMSIPARLSAQLAAEASQMKIHDLLTVEIHRICTELAAGERGKAN